MKHILYFAGYRMVLLRWKDDFFSGMSEFEPDEKGYAAFKALLSNEVEKPIKLLIDIIEEDFRLDKIPRLYGKDRNAIKKRVINKYFRNSEYTYLQIQDRRKSGRRDENVLVSSLTNPKLFSEWLDILHELKIPLEGIYSLPLVGESLLKPLTTNDKNVLIISQQVPGSIRQSFYSNGHLKLTRLAPGGDDSATYYNIVREETEKTTRYLENQHYTDTEQPLDIYIIAPASEHDQIHTLLKNDFRKKYHILDKDRLGYQIGIKGPLPDRYCSWLYAHLLLSGQYRKSHYGNFNDKRYFHHYRAKKSMYGLSASIIIIAAIWGLLLITNGYLLSSEQQTMLDETTRYNRLFDEIISDISNLNLDVKKVRDAVDTADSIQRLHQNTPIDFMYILSESLEKHPRIEIKKIKWLLTQDSNHSFGETKKILDRRTLKLIQLGRKSINYEKALVEAYVTEYQENPRVAVEEVNRFIQDIKSQEKLSSVDIIKLPFDVDPASRMIGQGLSGSSSGSSQEAGFAFVVSKETEI